MFSPLLPFHLSGWFCPSATPDACGPLIDGQLPFADPGLIRDDSGAPAVSVIFRGGTATVSLAGSHVLRSRIIRRGIHSSASTSNVMLLALLFKRYLPGPSQPPGPPLDANSISLPDFF